jgi:mannosyl-oligosaccharide alpha-1,2-mannosidase
MMLLRFAVVLLSTGVTPVVLSREVSFNSEELSGAVLNNQREEEISLLQLTSNINTGRSLSKSAGHEQTEESLKIQARMLKIVLQHAQEQRHSKLSLSDGIGSKPQEFPATWTKHFDKSTLAASQVEADKLAARVKDAMKFCWEGYKTNMGADDVLPLSGRASNWANMGVAVLESLDTLHLMGLKQEFQEADAFVKDRLDFSKHPHNVQTMEITIRALGGLLSAYSLTQKPEFLEKAKTLGKQILISAYNFNPDSKDAPQSLLPLAEVDLMHKRIWEAPHSIFTAEAGTLQLEFAELSAFTGDPVFRRVTGKSVDAMLDAMDNDHVDVPLDTVLTATVRGQKQVHFLGFHSTLGARVDSFLEYLVKAAVQDPSKKRLRKSFRKIMDSVFDKMVLTTKKKTTFIADLQNGRPQHQMDHLVCFMPGTLMMASRNFPPEEVDSRWEPLAAALTETCHKMYKITDSHLAPEFTQFDMGAVGDKPDMLVPDEAPWNLLRPEAAEAMFYMHQYTGDPKYRTWAADILQAFEKHSKGKFGFAAVDDVREAEPTQRDSQESFFLAETLKYLYLTFAKPDTLNLNKYVFNTEAHPLAIPPPENMILLENAIAPKDFWTSKEKDITDQKEAREKRKKEVLLRAIGGSTKLAPFLREIGGRGVKTADAMIEE